MFTSPNKLMHFFAYVFALVMLANYNALAQPGKATSPPQKTYMIGTYYYPGWKGDAAAWSGRYPWARIKKFPERKPLLGWYNEGDVDVMVQHLKWMHDHAINFVVFDWYWTGGRVRNEHALAAYFQAKNKDLVKFSILWANHEAAPRSEEDFISMVRYWVRYYFQHEQYQRINDRPVVHIFSPGNLDQKAKLFGSTAAELIGKANAVAQEHGFPGIYFVGGTAASAFAQRVAQTHGYQALSGYNYSLGRTVRLFDSYEALDRGYQEHWNWLLENSPLPYMLAISSGWDRRPWGGSKDPRRDLSFGTPEGFEKHLSAARALMDKYPEKSLQMAVICCWNEFGEGSYIEPTKSWHLQFLERVKKVFGSQN